MAVGIVLFLHRLRRRARLLLAGVGVLVVVVSELCLREHFAGFRSHSILLALLPVTVVHLAIVLLVSEDWRGPPALAVDLAVAGALAWWLQRRFRHAQSRARVQRRLEHDLAVARAVARVLLDAIGAVAAVDDVGAAADGADRVGAGPAEQAIVAEAAVELVAPAAAAQHVVAAPALELVVAVAAGEAVVAGAAEERVVVVAAVELVRAARALEEVVAAAAADDVGALRAEDPLRAIAGQAAAALEVAFDSSS